MVRCVVVMCAMAMCAWAQDATPKGADYTEQIRETLVEFDMVWIEEGGFWIGKTEVTWDEFLPYCAFDKGNDVPPDADAVSKPSKPLDVFPHHRDWGEGRRPAVGMSWHAAKMYCEWLSLNTGHTYRLPTEDEWTLACGPAPDSMSRHAWTMETSREMTQEVGQLDPNAQGVHDMLGNLWEYCLNPYAPDQPKRAVLRGGSWKENAADIDPANRLRFNNDWTLDDPNIPPGKWWIPDGDHLGFRVVRVPEDDTGTEEEKGTE